MCGTGHCGLVNLFVSEYVLEEISELHLKLPARAGIKLRPERLADNGLLQALMS
jgi:hypothetical protein